MWNSFTSWSMKFGMTFLRFYSFCQIIIGSSEIYLSLRKLWFQYFYSNEFHKRRVTFIKDGKEISSRLFSPQNSQFSSWFDQHMKTNQLFDFAFVEYYQKKSQTNDNSDDYKTKSCKIFYNDDHDKKELREFLEKPEFHEAPQFYPITHPLKSLPFLTFSFILEQTNDGPMTEEFFSFQEHTQVNFCVEGNNFEPCFWEYILRKYNHFTDFPKYYIKSIHFMKNDDSFTIENASKTCNILTVPPMVEKKMS